MASRSLSALTVVLLVSCFAVAPGCPGGAKTDETGTEEDPNDVDGDGYPAAEDCDDTDPAIHPDADENCDGVDNDCDGETDEGLGQTWYADDDGDGHGTPISTVEACSQPKGYTSSDDDCDDRNEDVYPGADEVCDGEDNDCDGDVDEDGLTTWYRDTDRDGYGEPGDTEESCERPAGYVDEGGDCDDDDPAVNPGADERCNGIDDNCDGRTDETGAVDATTWYPDDDRDTYGDASDRGRAECEQPAGYVASHTDCDDTDAMVYPGADEHCDGVDEDCDGDVDNDPVDATLLADDADGDGFGARGSMSVRCDGVENDLDCDDGDPGEPQVVDASGTGTPDGSAAHPWRTIQDGIDAAAMCVVVEPGLYTENLDFGGSDIAVLSSAGPADTTVDGSSGSGPVVTFASGEGTSAALLGFTLTGGTGFEETSTSTYSCGSGDTCTNHYTTWCGGGVYIDGATPTLENLVIDANDLTTPTDYESGNDAYYYFSYGGGICIRDTSIALGSLSLWNNYADDGGAVYVESTASATFEQTQAFSNHGVNGAAFAVDGGDLTLTNVLTAWNTASVTGGSIYAADATLSVTNTTSGEDDAGGAGGLHLAGTAAGTVMNAVFYGSDTGWCVEVDTTASYNGSYSDVYGCAAGLYTGITAPTGTRGNIASAPSFTSVSADGNFSNDNWHPGTGSPLINAGNSAAAYNDVDGTRNDIGCYGGPGGSW